MRKGASYYFPETKRNAGVVWGYLLLAFCILSLAALYVGIPELFPFTYISVAPIKAEVAAIPSVPLHLATPVPLKAVYMTSYVAGSKAIREPLIALIDDTEINAVVIDIKDYTGRIAFPVNDPVLIEVGSALRRITDIDGLIEILHKKGIYVIGRVSVFQDQYLVGKRPELAVKKKSDGSAWADYKGVRWLDAGARPVWEYVAAISKEAYARGFDEINLDYIRFPSDGPMNDISFPWSGSRKKSEVINEFFGYIADTLHAEGMPVSADLFGMTATNRDDLNIGQLLEHALAHFDYVAPMVYPSHYPPNFNGWPNPNKVPYEIIKFSMDSAVLRATNASTTPLKLRPWLQDFNYGGIYGAKEVRAQIQATYDAGLDSWMLWNPSNRYTRDALYSASTTAAEAPL